MHFGALDRLIAISTQFWRCLKQGPKTKTLYSSLKSLIFLLKSPILTTKIAYNMTNDLVDRVIKPVFL